MKAINDNLRDEILAKVIDSPEMLSNEDIELINNDRELKKEMKE